MDNHNWYFSSAKLSVNFFLAAQCGIGTLTFESYLDSNLVLLLIFCLLLGPIINSWSVSSFVKWGSIICLTGCFALPKKVAVPTPALLSAFRLSGRRKGGTGEGPSLPIRTLPRNCTHNFHIHPIDQGRATWLFLREAEKQSLFLTFIHVPNWHLDVLFLSKKRNILGWVPQEADSETKCSLHDVY